MTVTITVDGEPLRTQVGRSVAAALMLEGDQLSWRRTRFAAQPRGVFCGIGVCFDCLVTVDGQESLRACLVQVTEGMEITTRQTPGREPAAQEVPDV